jgi:DNA-binding response OmpR family regulator/Flp pilus assembly protein TadD
VAKQHLLLVDSDAKSLRVMEVSLKKAGFSVTTAVNGQDALDKVQISPPDLVLSDTRMPEMDGFELCRRLKTDARFEAVPFVFLTNQKSVEFKVKGLELGGDDYLTKPIYIKEIVTRLKMILQKAEKEHLEKRETKSGFSGSLADMGVVDLVQTFEIGRKTGTITISEEDRVGTVWFRDGRTIDAEMGRLKGENAFYRMLNTSDGKFEVSFGSVDRRERIEMSTQGLLMEGMRRLDEWGRMLEQLPPLDTVFEIDHRQLAERLSEIPDEVNGILRLFDGTRSLAQAVDDSEFEDLAALGLISKLYFEGLIRELGGPPLDSDTPAPSRTRRDEWLKGPVILSNGDAASDSIGFDDFGAEGAFDSPGVVAAPPQPAGAPLTQPAQVIKFAPKDGAVPMLAPEPAPVLSSPVGSNPAPSRRGALEEARARLLADWGREVDEGIVSDSAWGWAPPGLGTAQAPAPNGGGAPARHHSFSDQSFFSEEDALAGRGFFSAAGALPGQGMSSSDDRAPTSPGAAAGSPPRGESPAASGARTAAESTQAELVGEVLPLSSSEVTPQRADAETSPAPVPVPQVSSSGDHPTVVVDAALLGLPPYPGHGVPPKEHSAEDEFLDALPPLGPDVFQTVPPRRTGLVFIAVAIGIVAAAMVGFVVTRTVDAHGGGLRWAARGGASAGPIERGTLPPKPDAVAGATADGGTSARASDPVAVGAASATSTADERSGKPAPTVESANAKPAAVADGGSTRSVAAVEPAGLKHVAGADAARTKPAVGAPLREPPVVAARADADAGADAVATADVGADSSPRPRVDDVEYANLVSIGQAAIDEEKFKRAATTFRKALSLKPDSVDAKAGLGVALVGSDAGDSAYREAITLLSDVVRKDAQNARAWLALGLAYQMLGRDRQAVVPYRKYLVLEPRGRFADDVRSALSLIRE